MAFQLPPLSYGPAALAPYLSEEAMLYHYGKHHKAYVEKTNELIEFSELKSARLEDIVRNSSGPLFNNAAQAWNHTFYWECLTPEPSDRIPSTSLEEALHSSFGGPQVFIEKFAGAAMDRFGSGWVWLVRDKEMKLQLKSTSNAGTPITDGLTPLLVVDVWEHAYYIDYRNARKKYLESFAQILNWRFVSERYDSKELFSATDLMRGSRRAA